MNKKRQERIDENLARTLEPPKKKDPAKQNDLFKDYVPDHAISTKIEDPEIGVVSQTTVAVDHAPPKPKATIAPQTMMVAVARVAGETIVSNTVLDSLLPCLDPYSALLYLRLYRLSYGFHRQTCTVGLERLAKTLRVSKKSIQRAVEDLEQKGLIAKEGANFGAGVKGINFAVKLPATLDSVASVAAQTTVRSRARVAAEADIKRDLKKQYLKIRGELSEAMVGGSFDQFRAAFIRRCEGKGIEFDLGLFKEIFGG